MKREFSYFNDCNNGKYKIRLISRDENAGFFMIFDLNSQLHLNSKWFKIETDEALSREYIELPFYEFSRIYAE